VLLAIELLDELVGGTRAAAWPLIRHDLSLSYAQIGLVLSVPGFLGSALDPPIGAAGDSGRRRALLVAGGIGVAASAALTAGATGFWLLLAALAVGNPASGAFVSLAQATLMDAAPHDRERAMARWTLAGSFGYVGGPALLAAAVWAGVGWRGAIAALAIAALPLTFGAARLPLRPPDGDASIASGLRHAFASLRRPAVVRWIVLLEASDLLLDVFHGFLALYLVAAVGASPGAAALGVGVWTGAGLVGDWLLIVVLRRVGGLAYLRASAAAALVAYPAFLLVPGLTAKLAAAAVLGLLNSGWYAIPKARLYGEVAGRSGTAVALGGIGGLAGAALPLALGLAADAIGIRTAMWTLLVAPVALLALVPRRR
jgi:MFS transporter, FSR family, fosmidomycin resistance protein